ncbi:putative isochorismatase hydrolase protein [Daldinia childiae]|uniref:putative isochorismatase hydrolase protein n=1 Tax=Daldinia childiae TaxID=326645 RepID=UPI001446805D|nr:putative isochorismatase hydrolase protein [Daldinia childiae]KAF3058322.1 putative isochorismatase hydrolase protein [Daldinia childiae]
MPRNETTRPNQPAYYGSSQTALLVMDYLNMLVDMMASPERQALIDSVNLLLATARKNKVPIIHCLIDTSIDPPPTSKIYEQWFTVNKPAIEANPELVEEYADFAPPPGNIAGPLESVSHRLPGPRSAFINKSLLPFLREHLGVKSLILGGIGTSGVVLGTALQGTDEDFIVTVVEDAVWDPNAQVNRDLLDVVLPVSAWVVSTEEAVGYMKRD